MTTTEERLIGYKKAFRENGLEYDSVWIEAGDSRYKSGYNLCRKLLEENDLSALFVTNNLMSIGAMNYIREAGIKVPEDIALIGFDDYRLATITFPPLSVVKQPVSDIGKKAGKLILEKIANKEQGKNINGYQDYRFRASLKLWDSC